LCEDCISLIPITQTISETPNNSVLSALFSAASYENSLIKTAIHYLKYPPFIKDLAIPLAYIIIAHFSFIDKPRGMQLGENTSEQISSSKNSDFVLLPIPLSRKRLKWRGFNHAELIALAIADSFQVPLYSNVIQKTKNTVPQMSLKKEERLQSMKGVFEVSDPKNIANKKILLIDDVYTTGATMEEAARVLKEAGAKQVFGVTVARG